MKAPVFAKSGIRVPYFRCSTCGFVFTNYLDSWTSAEIADRIYNADYILADPGFAEERPRYIAGEIDKLLGPMKETLKILDYGGGDGRLVDELRKYNFFNVRCFDPFFSSSPKPEMQFELVTAFEVVEHAVDPILSFEDALSFVEPNGALLFSTSLLSRKPDKNWFYIAPRNGHISIHSWESLQWVASRLGVKCLSLNNHLHLIYGDAASTVAKHIAKTQQEASLYAASIRGIRSFMQTERIFGELGFAKSRVYIRHLSRALLASIGLV